MKKVPLLSNTFIVLALLVLACSSESRAQVIKLDTLSPWKKLFRAGANLNQATFSENWKGGGVNSFGFNALMNIKANYRKGKTSYDNQIDLLYGMVNNEGQGYRKTMDRIFIDTKLGHSVSEHWDLFVSTNAVSQFAKGYKYEKDVNNVEHELLVSEAFSPTFITAAMGAEWHPVDYFKVRLSPLAPRVTLLSNNDGRYLEVDSLKPYGVNVGESSRFEWYAFQLLTEFNKDIATNINLRVRYVMFANYQTLEAKKLDHRVDLNLIAKITKYINVSLGGIFVYDYDQDTEVQYSQAFSLGILYSIQNYEDKK